MRLKNRSFILSRLTVMVWALRLEALKSMDRFYKECKKNLKFKFVLNTKPTHNCFLISSHDRLKNFPCIEATAFAFLTKFSDGIFPFGFQ